MTIGQGNGIGNGNGARRSIPDTDTESDTVTEIAFASPRKSLDLLGFCHNRHEEREFFPAAIFHLSVFTRAGFI